MYEDPCRHIRPLWAAVHALQPSRVRLFGKSSFDGVGVGDQYQAALKFPRAANAPRVWQAYEGRDSFADQRQPSTV